MGLHVQADPVSVLRTWAECLKVDGFVMFSTLGPGSLPELRALYQAEGWGPPLAPLVDMHDLGDMMVQAGLADPVVDQETLTLTWATAADALAELRTLGGNAAGDRFPGLRTPRWRRRIEAALEASGHRRADGRVALSFEVVYGHAFKPLPKIRVAAQTAVPLEDMKTWVRGGRRSSGSAP
jgi:malonyl-CoA O-methyltransferase